MNRLRLTRTSIHAASPHMHLVRIRGVTSTLNIEIDKKDPHNHVYVD